MHSSGESSGVRRTFDGVPDHENGEGYTAIEAMVLDDQVLFRGRGVTVGKRDVEDDRTRYAPA